MRAAPLAKFIGKSTVSKCHVFINRRRGSRVVRMTRNQPYNHYIITISWSLMIINQSSNIMPNHPNYRVEYIFCTWTLPFRLPLGRGTSVAFQLRGQEHGQGLDQDAGPHGTIGLGPCWSIGEMLEKCGKITVQNECLYYIYISFNHLKKPCQQLGLNMI